MAPHNKQLGVITTLIVALLLILSLGGSATGSGLDNYPSNIIQISMDPTVSSVYTVQYNGK